MTRSARGLLTSVGRKWRPLTGDSIAQKMPSGGFPLAAPQAHAGERVIKQVFDGDLRIDRISGNCEVILESRHGSIIVADQVGEYAHVSLKAAKDVIIDRGIGRHSLVQIVSGGDVVVGQQIGENSQLAITSTGGQIGNGPAERGRSTTRPNAETTVHIGGDICQHSSAKITAQNDVTIDGGIRQHANLDIISLHGTIIIGHGIGESAVALVTAGRAVRVGEKLGRHSKLTIMAHDDVMVGQTVEGHADAKITSVTGRIDIGQGLRNGATATLIATNGSITIDGAVDQTSIVNWSARVFNCLRQDGTIKRLRPLEQD